MAGATGMSNVRSGLNFAKARHVSAAPKRSSSIIDLMSAKDMVREFDRRGSNDGFGIEGYYMPKNDSPTKKQPHGYIPKNKMPGPIQAEMKFRKDYPGVVQYALPIEKDWSE